MPAIENTITERVVESLRTLIEAGRPHHGLFPSVLEIDRPRMLVTLPATIEGQRDCDRAFPGSNLMHDHPTLRLMLDLAEALDQPTLAQGAEVYLQRFASHCTNTPTGLFPWGEHSFWNLLEDRPGNSMIFMRSAQSIIHDHLHQAPFWLWEKLWALDRDAVERFCDGLDLHYVSDERVEYIRHAPLLGADRPATGVGPTPRSCDFPRHGGHYVIDWAFALAKTGRSDFREQIQHMADYWWEKRSTKDLLFSESRNSPEHLKHHRRLITSQTLSLGVSLLEAAGHLREAEPALATMLSDRGRAYCRAFLAAPHDLGGRRFASSLSTDLDQIDWYQTWRSAYGNPSVISPGLLAARAHQLLPEEPRLLEFAAAAAQSLLETRFPVEEAVPARDPGVALDLLCELYVQTDQGHWLTGAAELSQQMLGAYLDQRLPRAASGLDYYESQLMPGHLLRGLARTALLTERGRAGDIGGDFTLR